MKAFILLYILPPPNSTGPRTIECASPLRSPTVARPLLFLPHRARDNLVGCCVKSLTGSLLKPRRISFHLFFWPVIQWPKRCDHFLPNHLRPAHRLSQIYTRYGRLTVGCCVIPCGRSHHNPRPHHPLYFKFFHPSSRHLKR